MTNAHVAPEHRGGGLGRMMVQGMAKDLIRRGGVRAVEAFGDTRGRTGHCVVPADFLLAVGFSTHRAHAVNPRMRMDLRTTLSSARSSNGASRRCWVRSPASGPGTRPRCRTGAARAPAAPTRQAVSTQAPWNESRISLTRRTPVWASTSGLR